MVGVLNLPRTANSSRPRADSATTKNGTLVRVAPTTALWNRVVTLDNCRNGLRTLGDVRLRRLVGAVGPGARLRRRARTGARAVGARRCVLEFDRLALGHRAVPGAL